MPRRRRPVAVLNQQNAEAVNGRREAVDERFIKAVYPHEVAAITRERFLT